LGEGQVNHENKGEKMTKTAKGTRINGFFKIIGTDTGIRGCYAGATPFMVIESLQPNSGNAQYIWWSEDEAILQIPTGLTVYVDAFAYPPKPTCRRPTLRRVTLKVELNGVEVTYPRNKR
jgi:hypothetical protein